MWQLVLAPTRHCVLRFPNEKENRSTQSPNVFSCTEADLQHSPISKGRVGPERPAQGSLIQSLPSNTCMGEWKLGTDFPLW